ncbi:MAG TPA: zinc ABC transporter substrate-binding protein [Planctomycetaceae bacterium]|nr:zinc ABC transporter substrate-binding protein [Planctomycetaceae bacterium]
MQHRSLVVLGLAVVLSGCRADSTTERTSGNEKGKPTIAVTNAALEYFSRRLAGSFATVEFPAPPEVDPAFWQPSEEAIHVFQSAHLIVLNGAGYEHWLDKVSLPRSHVIDTSAGFRDRHLEIRNAVRHRHGPSGEHAHDGPAVGTWLDPDLAVQQAESLYRELKNRFTDHADEVDAAWERLHSDLNQWRSELESLRSKYRERRLWASHPVYEYLGRWSGWRIESVHWEPNEMPDEEAWKAFDQRRKTHAARFMLWEDDPIEAIRQAVEQRGMTIVVFRPCGNRPPQGDWLAEMRANTRRLRDTFEKTATETSP